MDHAPLLSVKQASDVIHGLSGEPAPRLLHQFWDSDPPREIWRLLRHNEKMCRRFAVKHVLWTDDTARAFVAATTPGLLDLFDRIPFPTMRCDLFRLIVLHEQGGVYLDADMALRKETGARLWQVFTHALLFKWTHPDRRNAPNWCFGARAGHPMLAFARDETAHAIDGALADPEAALKRILGISGPGRFTQACGSWLAGPGAGAPGITVLDVEEAYRMVQNGPELLRRPLQYKKTTRHWKVAAGE